MTVVAAHTLTLIDRGGKADGCAGDIAWWDDLVAPKGSVSVPQLAEARAEALRDEYVDWCASLARLKLGDISLAERLSSRLLGGGSFWWSTLIAQRSPMASPAINDVLRLRALERHYMQGGYAGLSYCGTDARLAAILGKWARSLGHGFRWRKPAEKARRHAGTRWFDRLPQPVRALLYFGHFMVGRYRHARSGSRPPSGTGSDLVIVTYFPNIDLARAREGEFVSNYWGPLPALIRRLGLAVTWVWFYANSTQMSYAESAALRFRLNGMAGEGERFLMLEDHLSPSGIAAALSAYLGLWFESFLLGDCRRHFRLADSRIDFFPLLSNDWYSSLRGTEAMKHCLYAAAFSGILAATGPGRRGLLYLWENQGWEQLLLYASRACPGAQTLAVVHSNSCTAPMYMRTCLRSEPVGDGAARPLPDRIAAFGEVPRRILGEWGWPADRLTTVEALRYMGLGGKQGAYARQLPETGRRLLVVTGYMHSETDFQIRLLARAIEFGALATYGRVTVKPHPYLPVDDILREVGFPGQVEITAKPLGALFEDADVVYAANSTSAGIEAAWVGLPLILTAAVDGLNLSPLMGLPGVEFVVDPQALGSALKIPRRVELGPEHYNLDAGLPRWTALIEQWKSPQTEGRKLQMDAEK